MTERARIEVYLTRLYGYVLSLAGDHHQAEDLVQESAMRALSATNIPGDEPAYRAWLFRILRNAFIDQTRRRKTVAMAAEDKNSSRRRNFGKGMNVISLY